MQLHARMCMQHYSTSSTILGTSTRSIPACRQQPSMHETFHQLSLALGFRADARRGAGAFRLAG